MAEPVEILAPDGAHLTCWDYGGGGDVVLTAHGVGLHGRCFGPMARALNGRLRVLALDLRAHGRSSPSPDGDYPWERFGQDVLAVCRHLGLDGGVIGAGHSAGGSALLMAESARPGTFVSLWAWEPVVSLPGNDLREGRSAELAARARKRRSAFASLADARDHLAGRGLFAEMSDAAFEAYLEGGFVPGPQGGVVLACTPEVEARIYDGAPDHDTWGDLAGVTCPVRLLGGRESPAVPPWQLELIAGQLAAPTVDLWAGSGHFGPFQVPGRAAADLAEWAGVPSGVTPPG